MASIAEMSATEYALQLKISEIHKTRIEAELKARREQLEYLEKPGSGATDRQLLQSMCLVDKSTDELNRYNMRGHLDPTRTNPLYI
jgi:hypothetical protein